MTQTEPAETTVPPRRRGRLRRTGCIILLVIWFAILLTPCFLIMLAVQGELAISTGSAPGQQTRLWLISEPDERGLGLSTASVVTSETNAICVQTDVHFYLWTGSAEPTVYCECYHRDSAESPWSYTEAVEGACPQQGT